MRKSTVLALLGAALGVAMNSQTLAADIPAKAPAYKAPVVAPAYNWTGLYIGINGGYGWGRVDWTYVVGGTTANHDTSGGLIGATLGYNHQVGNWVFGLEGDWAWAEVKGSTACPNAAFSCRSELQSIGTIRGRVGYAWNNFLPYLTGGWAFGDQRIETVNAAAGTNGTSHTASGWTFGGGLEYGINNTWSAKLEYLYADLGTDRYTVDNALQVDARHKVNIFRAGLNYRFWIGR
jgi:outer membrane immunogenic protein